MSMKIKKYLEQLPSELTPDTFYFVKRGERVVSYLSNSTGTEAYEIDNGAKTLSLNGQHEVMLNVPQNFTITNFDTHTNYVVSSETGEVTRLGAVIKYVATSDQTEQSFTVNGRLVTLTLVYAPENTPPTFEREVVGVNEFDLLVELGTDEAGFNNYNTLTDSNQSVAISQEGNILLAYKASNTSGYIESKILVVKLAPTQQRDEAYGYKLISVPDHDVDGIHTAIQSDGKLLIAFIQTSRSNGLRSIGVVRLLQYGEIDTSYGVNGFFTLSAIEGTVYRSPYFAGMAVTFDDRLILATSEILPRDVAESFIFRINPLGQIDTTFGENGKYRLEVETNNFFFSTMHLQATGSLIFSGFTYQIGEPYNGYLIGKLDQWGTAHPGFGSGGLVAFHEIIPNGNVFSVSFIKSFSDGSLIVGGDEANQSCPYLAKLTPDGSIDTSFGFNGFQEYPGNYNHSEYFVNGIVLPDNSVIATLYQENFEASLATVYCQAVKKYTSTGMEVLDFNNSIPLQFPMEDSLGVILDNTQKVLITLTPLETKLYRISTYSYTQNGNLNKDLYPLFIDSGYSTRVFQYQTPYFFPNIVEVYDSEMASLKNGSGNYEGAVFLCSRDVASSADQYGVKDDCLLYIEEKILFVNGVAIGKFSLDNFGQFEVVFSNQATQARVNKFLQSFYYCDNNWQSKPESSSFEIFATFYDSNPNVEIAEDTQSCRTQWTFYHPEGKTLSNLPDAQEFTERIADGRGGYYFNNVQPE